MDYKKAYDSLIARSRTRSLFGYVERHHVIPRCLGGGDSADNIAILTPEEHYIAHQLLVKIFPNNPKLVYALHKMTSNAPQTKRSNKCYGWVRRRFAEAVRQTKLGKRIPSLEDKTTYTWFHDTYGSRTCSRLDLKYLFPNLDIDTHALGLVVAGKYRSLRGWRITEHGPVERPKGYVPVKSKKRTGVLKHSDESRKKMSDARRGISQPNKIDRTSYKWIHPIHGVVECSRYDLSKKFPELKINTTELGKVVNPRFDKIRSHRSWELYHEE